MAVSKKLTRDALRALYPAPSADFETRVSAAFARLRAQQGKEENRMKKKLCAGLILTALLTAAAFGALAAALDWNVLDFLFPGLAPDAGPRDAAALVQPVDASGGDGRVALRISGALTDGEVAAFDWRIENTRPEEPVFVAVEDFTGNGERLFTDGTDGFDRQWLPGVFSEDGAMLGGELVELPASVRGADALDVALTVAVYRPLVPVWDLGMDCDPNALDLAPVAQRLAEGGIVTCWDNGFAVPDAARGAVFVFGSLPDELAERFARTAFTLSFTLDLSAGRAGVRALRPQADYGGDPFPVRYTKASVSPLGLALEMDILAMPEESFALTLTDGEGVPLEAPWPVGEITTESAEDGSRYRHARFAWYGLTEEHLPDIISLSYFPKGGEPSVFPVRVR